MLGEADFAAVIPELILSLGAMALLMWGAFRDKNSFNLANLGALRRAEPNGARELGALVEQHSRADTIRPRGREKKDSGFRHVYASRGLTP